MTDYLSETWLKEFIKNPGDIKFYGTRNNMPGFSDKLNDKELDALIQYLFSLSKDRLLVSENENNEVYTSGQSFFYTKLKLKTILDSFVCLR
ncbi:MAG: hypothetical protein A2Z57_08845 [Planctomycetes bacterium RIFCSPHIGHO2_12_39_6]|nr:MAG: hypothetical protein A2Z57_08845 [Planctomycetes bacterium RIFCSPHIGHO2_12_39_6]